MERIPELFDTIEAYINQTLSLEEKTAFEQQMQADDSLAKEVLLHQQMHRVLSDRKTLEFRQKVQKVRQEMLAAQEDTTNAEIPAPNKAKFPYWKLAIAAVFVIGLGLVFWDNGIAPTNADLYAAYYKPFPVDDTTRGSGKEELVTIYSAYTYGDYEVVIPALEQLLEQDDRQKLRLYLGNSYLNTDQTQKAIKQFRKVNDDSLFYEDAQWYLALTYLREKVSDSTTFFLKNVIDYKGIHQRKAEELLQKLK